MVKKLKATKKPVAVTVMYFNKDEDAKPIAGWCGGLVVDDGGGIVIDTAGGSMLARHGDFIIQGVDGDFYACNGHIFLQAYNVEGL